MARHTPQHGALHVPLTRGCVCRCLSLAGGVDPPASVLVKCVEGGVPISPPKGSAFACQASYTVPVTSLSVPSGGSDAAIIGGAVGGAVGGLLLLAVVTSAAWYYRRRAASGAASASAKDTPGVACSPGERGAR